MTTVTQGSQSSGCRAAKFKSRDQTVGRLRLRTTKSPTAAWQQRHSAQKLTGRLMRSLARE